MKLAKIVGENLHTYGTTGGISIFRIVLKIIKRQGFTPSLENTVLEKPQGGVKLTSQPFSLH